MNNKRQEKRNNRNRRKTKAKKSTGKKILIGILIVLLLGIAWFTYRTYKNGWGLSGMLATVVGHDENTKKNLSEIKVLILGVSTDLDSQLTDTIMVASYNPNTQKANLLSIPRDSYTGKNTAKATASLKINALYNIEKTPEKTLKAVNEITGLDIKYYVIVKTEALIQLVDAIGGVEFNVPIDMKYDDPTQDLHIDLKAGTQKLDGEKAEQVLRFRHSNPDKNGVMSTYPSEYGNDDFGRMRTQRDFISALLKQTLKPGNIFKLGEILEIAHKNVETNLELSYIKDYIPYAVEFNTDNLQTATLPGTTPDMKDTNNVSIFVINKKLSTELIQSMFYVDSTEETEDNTITNSLNTTSNSISSTTTIKDDELKIELINGSGNTSKLEEAKTKLEEAGCTVKKTGKTSTISKTVITNKKNATDEQLKNIKQVLNAGSISTNKQASSQVDITIVIGEDFK
ncbi:LytR family transcriptional regulator [bacterium]|nr:LytR family transcriptional regulator [bacterium]